ncbi:MAG: hypothetical protein R3B48_23760 [Kofleriaceae bacterium]
MARLAAALALLAMGLTLAPMPWLFVGLGVAILAITAGLTLYRRAGAPGAARLLGAGAVTVALFALLLSTARIAVSLAAAARLERLLG